MLTRNWAYGSTREVEVLDVEAVGGFDLLYCQDVKPMGREGFVLLDGEGRYRAVCAGDRGVITFTRGGPTGGHWVYSGESPKGGVS